MLGRACSGVSSRLIASSIAAMFSGKSRTVIVRNSLLAASSAPLNPLVSSLITGTKSSGMRLWTSNTRFLNPELVTNLSVGAGWLGVWPKAAVERIANNKGSARVLSFVEYMMSPTFGYWFQGDLDRDWFLQVRGPLAATAK